MQLAITIEGQRGLTWGKLKVFAPAVEALGFSGLFRSDHFVDADPPDLPALELWVTLTWLAEHTHKLRIGSLVTPFSFRHPVHTARMAQDLNDLSGGRFTLGVGAGWDGASREHAMFGFDLLETKERLNRYEEGLEVVSSLLKKDEPVTFTGKYYQLQEARLVPAPERVGRPQIMVGGNGAGRILRLAARYADEWNAINRTPAQVIDLTQRLDALLDENQRPRQSVKRSQMKTLVFGMDQVDLDRRLGQRKTIELQEQGALAGCAAEVVEQLDQLVEAGVEQVVVQWPDIDAIDRLEVFSHRVLEPAAILRNN